MTDGSTTDLEACLDRRRAEFADGTTMAALLEELDRYRAGGISGELITETIRATRDAGEARLDIP
ncbi:hypothetical protein [Amycolatopsis pithecellobii]|uniref:Uncharacterized protein n=1 Tax=Amycolatopsis pithecellobii TaxID=664692 RepID=A0A6N7Z8U1_9PSEU|nr:hypothetical protein [Amycolatopsis pithecellobii]MTD57106.1 hypothetical protein [Amycolatopsis pithecellobii]